MPEVKAYFEMNFNALYQTGYVYTQSAYIMGMLFKTEDIK